MEKRRFTRVPFGANAIVEADGVRAEGEIENICLNGMLVKTADELPSGAAVEARVYLAGSTADISIRLDGTVVRSGEEGLAIEFDMSRIELDSFVLLRNVVSYAVGDPEEVLKEYSRFLDQRASNAADAPKEPPDEG